MRRILASAALLALATAASPGPPSFPEVLAEVRKGTREHRAQVARWTEDGGSPPAREFRALFDENVGLRTRLRAACEASGRRLSQDGTFYFDVKPLAAAGWTFSDPPKKDDRGDPQKHRALVPEIVAHHRKEGMAGDDVVVRFDHYTHRVPTASNGAPRETYPFAGAAAPVVCSDVRAVLAALTAEWTASHPVASSSVEPAKKSAGVARWTAAARGRTSDDAPEERCAWYAWEGQSFSMLHDGATFVATATFAPGVPDDAKTAAVVVDLLKAVKRVCDD